MLPFMCAITVSTSAAFLASRMSVALTPLSCFKSSAWAGFVRERDSESLAAAMELLLEDPALRRRLGTNGRQRVMDAFSLDRSTGKVRDLLLRAGDKAQPGPDRVEAKASRGLKTTSQEVARS